MAELQPDIHQLFRHYNALYFDDALRACIVTWTPRLRRIIGTCRFIKAGLCKIYLSESLLKPRPSVDLKNYLLHEMIHAFLWIKKKNKNRSQHGPNFWNIANEINSNFKCDDQRPSDGYKITDQHEFHDEADSYVDHQWKNESCEDLTKTSTSMVPSRDWLQKTSNEDDSSKLSCQWHRSKNSRSSRYSRVDVSSLKGKRKTMEGSCYATRRTSREQSIEQHEKAEDNTKRQRTLTHFCSSADDKCREQNNSFRGDCIQKCRSTNYRKQFDDGNVEERDSYKRKREITLIIPWLGVCTDEESEEDLGPLINNRSRKRMNLLKELDGRSEQIGLTHQEIIILD